MNKSTITSRAAALLIWADHGRRQAPGINWREFDELVEELRESVPGVGPFKSERGYYRALSTFQILAEYLACGDGICPDTVGHALEAGIRELERAIQP